LMVAVFPFSSALDLGNKSEFETNLGSLLELQSLSSQIPIPLLILIHSTPTQ
jgi:hypothetical protein